MRSGSGGGLQRQTGRLNRTSSMRTGVTVDTALNRADRPRDETLQDRSGDGYGNADAQHDRDDSGFVIRVLKCPIPTPGHFKDVHADAEGEKGSSE